MPAAKKCKIFCKWGCKAQKLCYLNYAMSGLVNSSDSYGPAFKVARMKAFARSGGRCQCCGVRDAIQAHHYAIGEYPLGRAPRDGEMGREVQADDLTALCEVCHRWATKARRCHAAGEHPRHLLERL